jgi:type VI secretion system protein ImpE
MPTAAEHYRSGNLADAVSAATDQVKSNPTDVKSRGFLAEMLCFTGDIDRADKQLDAILEQDPNTMVGVAQFRQLIRAEKARQELFNAGRVPEFLDQPDEAMKERLRAVVLVREGKDAEAGKLLEQLESQRKAAGGTCDGQAFDDVRDLDDLLASVLEVLTSNGKYYWIPLDKVELLEFVAPKSPRELIWRQAKLSVRGSIEGVVHIPVLYPGTHASEDNALRLGRSTDWSGGDGSPTRGVGQRTFLVGENDKPILTMTKLEVNG